MTLAWQTLAWNQYLEWQVEDKNVVKKINELIKECLRTPFEGKGKPEMLRANLSGYWSRRISDEHRLIYKVEKDLITIIKCKYHFDRV
ncbi:Txe/YoeB family addiction module toxin [Dyadobacter luticola]|uniref:Putative mRNA interferase YoeB n=1 Tax=Dyadobacter luticola TaxID=1979387 RepID=A0A5R9KT38_9BACT|nr:Txe/YoeB family addiction module toxin [Dyadobacter luticola]TLU99327.1 Txe/YoeB family addiction module toxin [Dyadobacter luticola]